MLRSSMKVETLIFVWFWLFSGKANRLKAAKKEADTEINNYKTERERQYKDYEAKVRVHIHHSDDTKVHFANVTNDVT